MLADHEEADDVFPKEAFVEQVLSEHDLLPDRAGHHDGVQHERLDHDGEMGRLESLSGLEVAQHEQDRHRHDEELDGRKDTLHQRPLRIVAALALFWRIEPRAHRRG